MKLLKKIGITVVALCLLMSISSYASESLELLQERTVEKSILLSPDILYSKGENRTVTRGDFLSTGTTQISNLQNGSLRISIKTYTHNDVDRIFHTVFLDQWDEEEQDWGIIGDWDFVKSKEEVANGALHTLETTFTVTGCEVGKYYRLRGLHGAEYNDEVEAFASETDGVLLTDRN